MLGGAELIERRALMSVPKTPPAIRKKDLEITTTIIAGKPIEIKVKVILYKTFDS